MAALRENQIYPMIGAGIAFDCAIKAGIALIISYLIWQAFREDKIKNDS